ncbi:MAG: hypothetical protein ACM336_14485 [Acidobacteriota bacterium]
MRRRDFVGLAGAAFAGPDNPPRVRAITRGPNFHWFGYYDKLQFDPSNRYALAMRTGFEHRSPRPDDLIQLGMIDLQDHDRWQDLGETTAWCWQQGCMLQWVPGSASEVIWNGREDGQYVSRILDVKTGRRRTLPGPVYALSPDGSQAVTTDFRRLSDTRPGYGYNGIPDPNRDVLAPGDSGIWRMDLRSGARELIFSVRDAVRIPCARHDWHGAKHWFNHLLYAPDGKRIVFLHRWTGGAAGSRRVTRMLTLSPEGCEPHVVDDFGGMSHFIWRDANHILGWADRPPAGKAFYLFEDRARRVEAVGARVMNGDGHCTYLPGNRWILCDTYPDAQRLQHPYLFDTRTNKRHPLGHFFSPPEYTGEWRCDTHPRASRDGRLVTIDSPHAGGRQIYLMDVGTITG